MKMGFFNRKKKNVKETAAAQEAERAKLLNFMAPVGANGLPLTNSIMSQGHNSHTLFPKIPCPAKYPPAFEAAGLKDTYLVDFPGMFESRGPELDIAINVTLQKVLVASKSAKALVLVQASILEPQNTEILNQVKQRLAVMFKEPEKHLVIGITKARMVQDTYDEDELVDIATG